MKQQTKNLLLKRSEISLGMKSAVNPGIAGATTFLAEEFKADPECVVIRAVRSSFGSDEFIIEAHIYESVAYKTKFEPRLRIKKAAAA